MALCVQPSNASMTNNEEEWRALGLQHIKEDLKDYYRDEIGKNIGNGFISDDLVMYSLPEDDAALFDWCHDPDQGLENTNFSGDISSYYSAYACFKEGDYLPAATYLNALEIDSNMSVFNRAFLQTFFRKLKADLLKRRLGSLAGFVGEGRIICSSLEESEHNRPLEGSRGRTVYRIMDLEDLSNSQMEIHTCDLSGNVMYMHVESEVGKEDQREMLHGFFSSRWPIKITPDFEENNRYLLHAPLSEENDVDSIFVEDFDFQNTTSSEYGGFSDQSLAMHGPQDSYYYVQNEWDLFLKLKAEGEFARSSLQIALRTNLFR